MADPRNMAATPELKRRVLVAEAEVETVCVAIEHFP
jgi:hypothetical protein